jgi:hypothetical protein
MRSLNEVCAPYVFQNCKMTGFLFQLYMRYENFFCNYFFTRKSLETYLLESFFVGFFKYFKEALWPALSLWSEIFFMNILVVAFDFHLYMTPHYLTIISIFSFLLFFFPTTKVPTFWQHVQPSFWFETCNHSKCVQKFSFLF